MSHSVHLRSFPIGAEVVPDGGVHFRVWAPHAREVAVVLESGEHALAAEDGGYFAGLVPDASAGTLYRFRLDDGEPLADPASRFQPEGPKGPSQVIDPSRFVWTDQAWRGVDPEALVLYELHLGTFTPEGTWAAAAGLLPRLADLGVTAVEVMPVADFPGRFGWGYDGVCLYAPTRLYGAPDDMRAFVDRAHALGVGVVLDVVYNHLGPDGNVLHRYAPEYFSERYKTDWGQALNFDGPLSEPVRELFAQNARYWVSEFHLDGLRLDATQQIFDASGEHVLGAITREAKRGSDKPVVVIAENECQHPRLVRAVEDGGLGLDMIWNDDLHHSARVALTGHAEAYYSGYRGSPQELVSAMRHGFLYQGQLYAWQKKRRGKPAFGVPPHRFVTFIENHDQVANSLLGRHLHQLAGPEQLRAMTAFVLLGPGTPMLFQGQEDLASAPFVYFADHEPDLAAKVRAGRREFLCQFPSIATPEAQELVPDPDAEETFRRCVIDEAQRRAHPEAFAMHKDLLRVRRETPVLGPRGRRAVEGAVLAAEAFVLRFLADDPRKDRLLLVNLGRDLTLEVVAEPLLAPPEGTEWRLSWSSEAVAWGGEGHAPAESPEAWRIPGPATYLLSPEVVADGSDRAPDPVA